MPDLKPTSLDIAMEYIDEGNYVFPAKANKAPACNHGFKAAVNTPEEAEELWSGKNAPLLGIDCGRSNIWVLDIDPDGLGWLDENRDIIPETQCYKTPRGGFHYVFAGHPTIRNSSNKITKGVDVRGIGGYVCRGTGYDIIHDADVAEASPELIHLALEANRDTASSQTPAPAAPTSEDVWGKLTDGREAKMAEMVFAKCADAIREVGFDKAYDEVIAEYPDYERLVAPRGESLEADGRGLSEWKKKTRSTLAKLEREGAPELRSTISCGLPLEQIGFIDPAQLPKRKIIHGLDYIEGTISMTVAAGGVGKSTAIIYEACSIANKGHNVMLLMLEDEPNEVKRRVKACVMHHNFDEGKVGANLVILSQEQRLTMAAVDTNQAVAVDYDKLRDAIKLFGTQVLIVDPFVQTHQMNENDNQQINFVADLFRSIAKECHIAVMLVHHTRKGAEFGARGENARGASALKDAARNVRELRLPTPNDVRDLNIEPTKASELIIVDHTKANYTRLADLRYLRKVIVEVRCGLIETETVATVEPYDLAAHTIQISDEHYDTALKAIALKQDGDLAYVKNISSKSLNIYKDLAAETGLTLYSCKQVIEDLIANGKVKERQHKKQKVVLYVVTSE
jgi:KaiC/GvpD/RAD55 family RecA-like ATPase